MRLIQRLYRQSQPEAFLSRLAAAAESQDHVLLLDEELFLDELELKERGKACQEIAARSQIVVCIEFGPAVASVYMPYLSGLDYRICLEAGKALGCAWFELRIQEGNHWDYSFYKGGEQIDQFSSDPRYFEEDFRQVSGRADLIAREWGIPEESISEYLRFWRAHPLKFFQRSPKGKAYPGDLAPYGNYEQMFDFVRKLGLVEPDRCYFPMAPIETSD